MRARAFLLLLAGLGLLATGALLPSAQEPVDLAHHEAPPREPSPWWRVASLGAGVVAVLLAGWILAEPVRRRLLASP